MKFLMTGYSGFIGQHLTAELRLHGHEVIGLDRNGVEGTSEIINLEDVYARPFLCDVSEPGAFSEFLHHFQPDKVIHLAAQVGREFGEDDLERTIRWNASGTALVANACGKEGIPVLYTSTSEVYGDLGDAVATEYGPKTLPHNLYGLSKRWGEEALELYDPNQLQIARLSMPYGPGAPPGRGRRAMDNFMWQANHGQAIKVHDGAKRSWCWVGDTVYALRLIAESYKSGVWNVGRDDDERTLVEVALIACKLAGADPNLIEIVPAPNMQTVVKRLSTLELEDDFGWAPRVELEQGMEILWEWIKQFDAEGNRIGY